MNKPEVLGTVSKVVSVKMQCWLLKIVLLTASLLCVHVFSQDDRKVRIIHIRSDKSSSQGNSCSVDHCYSLQDVFNNQSYFFDSYTTLELLPGNYVITKSIGQLVIANVNNFTFKDSSVGEGKATISCQPSATFGLAFVLSHNIKISNIQFSHCSAKLNLSSSLLKKIITGNNAKIFSYVQLKHNLHYCNNNSQHHMLCYMCLAGFKNTNISVYQTSIIHSRGVGVYMFKNSGMNISKSSFAHNEINSIIFIAYSGNSDCNLSDVSFMFGHMVTNSFNLSSGLNLFVDIMNGKHSVTIDNITLANNRAPFGNFYMHVYYHESTSIDIVILINALTSIQIEEFLLPGMVVKYYIILEKDKKRQSNPFTYNYYCSGSSLWNFPDPLNTWDHPLYRNLFDEASLLTKKHKKINITIQNSAFIGSCITLQDSKCSTGDGTVSLSMRNIIINNSQCLAAISVVESDVDSIQLSDMTIIYSQHNILYIRDTNGDLEFSENTSIISNQGSVSLVKAQVLFKDFLNFSGNTAHQYESVLHVSDFSKVRFFGETIFSNNIGRQGGAIFAYSSSFLEFKGNAKFVANSAEEGGAINLKEQAVIHLKGGEATLLFQENTARTYGGAIYVEDAGYTNRHNKFKILCFIQTESTLYSVKFKDNKARKAGSALFGGWIDICESSNDIRPHHFLKFKSQNSVASNPTRVCICENSIINKDKIEIQLQVFPGQTFELEVATVGQRFGIVPATVRAEVRTEVIERLQKLQDTENKCTKLTYTVRSSSNNESMLLNVEGRDIPQSVVVTTELLQFRVSIQVKDCPAGFVFEKNKNICQCHHYLRHHGVQCNFDSYTVNRKAQQWIGVTHSTTNIIIHSHCPYDYCKPHVLSLNLSNPDEQCSFGRSGVLCGACGPGLSQVLGTSNCRRCSNSWLSLTVVFGLAGVMLVAGLMLLNLTVSEGTINGLVFYANIVRANTSVFFPGERANSFLSWFIAWLNLDVGVETCFYDRLDAYAKTWLQFFFPFYIWLMVAVVIIGSKYSKKLCSKNAVQVLATLFILSYAKLLRVTITVFQPTHLINSDIIIWHYDGNIVYLGKGHTPLLVAALLLFVLFFIPYTLIVFGIQWFQVLSHHKLFGWVNKFKPLFDAYTGPYKDKHRYWTGLLLLVRIGLFSVFSANTSGDPAINLLAIIVVIVCLLTYLALFAGIYKVWLLNVLEYSFLLNLIILSASVLYATSVSEPVHIMTQVSVSITLSITALIIIYHSTLVILRLLKAHMNLKISNFFKNKLENDSENNLKEVNVTALHNQVTHSVIELREPLIN